MGTTVMRLSRSGYLIREGFRSIGTHAFMSFASVTIIIACLVIMGSVTLLSFNVDMLIGQLEAQNEVVAFVDETLSAEEARAVANRINAVENISSAEFMPREEAMTSFMSNYSDELMEGIDETVFRHRFVIHLTDITLMKQTKLDLENVEGIAKVSCHTDYAKYFVSLRNVVTVVSLILVVILVLVSLFIMSNTIKLATYGRREEIAIMKIVGATNGFIRLPFVVEGLVLGIIGGSLAFLIQWGLYELVTGKIVGAISGTYISFVSFFNIHVYIFAVFVGIGIFVGVFGAINAIKNYLKV